MITRRGFLHSLVIGAGATTIPVGALLSGEGPLEQVVFDDAKRILRGVYLFSDGTDYITFKSGGELIAKVLPIEGGFVDFGNLYIEDFAVDTGNNVGVMQVIVLEDAGSSNFGSDRENYDSNRMYQTLVKTIEFGVST